MTLSIPARSTTYNGIRMRSRLEARAAAYLDELRLDWEYERECYANTDGQYLPDFQVWSGASAQVVGQPYNFHHWLDPGDPIFIEVKPSSSIEAIKSAAKRMSIILSSIPDALLLLWIPEMKYAGVYHRSWPMFGNLYDAAQFLTQLAPPSRRISNWQSSEGANEQ